MRKNTLLYCLVTLAIGYALGAFLGLPCGINSSAISGDVNGLSACNPYNEIITSPDYMCFQKRYVHDKDAQERTIASLRIMYSRIAEFNSLYRMVSMSTADNDNVQNGLASLTDVALHNSESFDAAAQALQAALDLQNGAKVDLKKALRNAQIAYNAIESQIAGGKAFVASVDSFITKDNLLDNIMVATTRDMVASHCSVNATLAQNDAEIDYWSNMTVLAPEVNMASK